MQLRPGPSGRPAPGDIAGALDAARRTLGHRPAVTVLRPGRRDEQGVASLAQWAAKGAHLLEADLLLGPGDRLALDVRPGWTAAAVALAAWWAGIVVTLDGPAKVVVLEEDRPGPASDASRFRVGTAIDGAPTTTTAGGDEPWVRAVQFFPDQPPRPSSTPDAVGLSHGGREWTHRELLAEAAALGEPGTFGIDATSVDPVTALLAVGLRPLVTDRPTVVLDGVGRDAAAGDRVAAWA